MFLKHVVDVAVYYTIYTVHRAGGRRGQWEGVCVGQTWIQVETRRCLGREKEFIRSSLLPKTLTESRHKARTTKERTREAIK